MRALSLCIMVLSCAVAHAADNDPVKVEGKVAELQGVPDREASFRVILTNAPPLCGTSFTYAYINEKDDNYNSMVELLLLAKSTKAPVMLVSQKDNQGHCKLRSVTVK